MCQILVALMFILWEYHDANAVFSVVNIFSDAHLIAFCLVFFQKFQFSGHLPLDPTKKEKRALTSGRKKTVKLMTFDSSIILYLFFGSN